MKITPPTTDPQPDDAQTDVAIDSEAVEPTESERLKRVLSMIDDQSASFTRILDNLAVMRAKTLAKLGKQRSSDAELERPPLRLVTSRATAQPKDADAPDTSTIDFMELVDTPMPTSVADQRVDLVLLALQGLDRHGIHEVLEAAGKVARLRVTRSGDA